ncbi:MAG: UvrD-helicase domain-containing protein [Candidatus Obscuribacter phosphatis]|uniref:DNA 3'-5' helicase n=1 Tax=Candidatus Obscuribacter phosphatis TaxID=1906157 RepID=A0A8J7TML7_9BACT|nr:UvrD-helicase domain-containing protein [Candidatus Obscuribacter phosphatis]
MSNIVRSDQSPNRMPPQPGESRDAVHWFVDSLGLYQGSARGLFLSDYSEDQEALIESAVINFKSRGVKSLVIAGEMLYKQADYLYQHAAAQTTFGRPLLSQLELDMIDADVLIVTDLVAPETPQQLWYFYHHLLYPRAMAQKPLILTTPLSLDEFLSYGAACDDLEYAGRRVTWEKVAWLMDGMLIDLHHFRMLKGENLPPMLKAEYFLYKALVSRGLVVTPQYVLGDYMLDFAMVERGNKLAVECDLLASLDNPNARSSEAKRTLVLLSDGWKLLRFTVVDLLANLMDCVDAVADVWVTGRKKSPSGRLVSGQASSHLVDLPVEDDIERRAITYGAGPIAITGGAGTGKSTCVARRVAHLLSQGVNPERILVISHSTESARSLRAELENLIDKPSLQRLHFHSWNELGLKLLKENTSAIKRKPPLKVEGNPQRVIQRLLTKYKRDLDQMTLEMAEELEEFTLASLISLYKANLITPKHVKDRAKNSVDELVARVYQGYEEQLQKSNKIDRDDMVTMAAQLLADNADIRARYQYQFEFVLVDEYQDANAAADLLLRMLALPQDNLFISGDEDQSIYESKGSLPKLIAEVSLRLPNARCFVLENNWRSHPDIVELANRLLTGMSRRRIRKEMVPGWEMSGDRAVVGPQLAETEAAEAEWVAAEIESLLAGGRNPQDIAILYRYNRYASLVEEALFRRGIKCLTTNPDSTMVPDEVADIMAFLRLVMDPDGPKARESFERVCQLRTKEVDPRLFNTIASFAEANNLSFLKAVEIYSEAVADQSCQDLEQLVRIIRTMNHENLPPAETIALLKRTQRLSEYYKAVKVPPGVNYEPMRKLTQLEEEARKFKTVGDFVRSQTSPKVAEGQAEPLVFILSLHESKGKEFPIVFLTGMAEGLFPSETASDPEEERRLCYLGMTRAKDMLYVSYPGKFNDVVLAPSRFLLETMQDATPRPVSVAAAPSPTTLAKPAVSTASAPAQSAQQEAALRAQQEAAQRAQQEAAQRAQQEAAQRAQQEAAQRAQQEAAQRAQQEAAQRAQQEAAQRAQQEAALKAQQEAALRAQQEAALRAQQEAALRAQQEAALRAQQEAALRAQQEAALRAQQEAALRAQQEAALRAQQEAALRAQQEAALRAQQEAALRVQQEAAQREAALRAQQEAELRAQQEAALRAQQEAALRAQQEAALRAQQEAALRAQQEAELRAQQEALKMQEASVRAQQEAALRAQQEAALRAQQEAALRAQQEAAMRAQQEAALRAQQEAAMRAQQEAAMRAQQEAALRAQQEAALRAQQEAASKAQQEAALNEEAAKEEAARKAKMEELQRAQQEEEQRLREQSESGKKGKKGKKAQAREEEKVNASDVRDVAIGLPPQSTPQAESAFSMPPAAQADASEDAFWQSVNSFSGGEIKPGGKAGVPPGVTAPIPQPDIPVYRPVSEPQVAQTRPAQELCPGCAEPLDPGSRFCGECGFRLETKIISCHLCGAPQEGDAKFCGECGSKLHDNKAAPAAPDAGSPLSTYEGYLSGQKPSQAGWVTRLKKIVE